MTSSVRFNRTMLEDLVCDERLEDITNMGIHLQVRRLEAEVDVLRRRNTKLWQRFWDVMDDVTDFEDRGEASLATDYGVLVKTMADRVASRIKELNAKIESLLKG